MLVEYLPDADRAVELLEKLAKGEKLELKWKNPGRHLPKTPEKLNKKPEKVKSKKKSSSNKHKDFVEIVLKDFDFESEIAIEKKEYISDKKTLGNTKTVAKASFDGVLKDVYKHKMWEKHEVRQAKE